MTHDEFLESAAAIALSYRKRDGYRSNRGHALLEGYAAGLRHRGR